MKTNNLFNSNKKQINICKSNLIGKDPKSNVCLCLGKQHIAKIK